MRQVIVRPKLINPLLRDFADHHGFEPKPPSILAAEQREGRRNGQRRENNFLPTVALAKLEDLTTQGRNLLNITANARTMPQLPVGLRDLLEKERPRSLRCVFTFLAKSLADPMR